MLDLCTWQTLFSLLRLVTDWVLITLHLHSCESLASAIKVRVRFITSDEEEGGPGRLALSFSLSLSARSNLGLDQSSIRHCYWSTHPHSLVILVTAHPVSVILSDAEIACEISKFPSNFNAYCFGLASMSAEKGFAEL